MQKSKVPFSHQLGYGIGVYGYGLTTQMISSYLIFYGTAVLRLPGGWIGLMVSLSVLWDGVSDPLMGYISDNTRSSLGKRHLYLLLGTLLMVAGNYALWTVNPSLSPTIKFLWLFVILLLHKTFITVYATPYNALGAEMTMDYDNRSAIQGVKTVFFILSILSVTAIGMLVFFKPSLDYPLGQLNPDAYRNMALTVSGLTLFTGLFTYFTTAGYRSRDDKKDRPNFSLFLTRVNFALKEPQFRSVLLGYLFTNLAAALIGTIGLHVFTYTFVFNNVEIATIFGVQFLMSILFQPFWVFISKKHDKKNVVIAGLKIAIAGSSLLFIMVLFKDFVSGHFEVMLLYAVIVGFGTSGLFSLPFSMVADTVDIEEHIHGVRNEGVYYGLLNFGYKISQALGIFCFGLLLDLIGFDSSLATQTPFTLYALGLLLPLGTITAMILSKSSFEKYTLTREYLASIQKKL